MAHHTSGMAASIRSSVDNETFDLAGHSAATIQHTIHDAFEEPLPLKEMIRITFITGAGKLGRQKYDEAAAKVLCQQLQQLGYVEDRGASAILECAGSYKMQHDTGKNLKTVVVFPQVVGPDAANGGLDSATQQLSLGAASILPENSPEHKIAHSTQNTFERMVESKCPSWSQKKGCVAAIDSILESVQELDEKLVKGQVLTDVEQELYDSISAKSLEEKQAYVREQMHQLVDDGKITAEERQMLLNQVSERLGAIDKEISNAQGKPKLLEKLEQKKAKAVERKEKLTKIKPVPPQPLKHEKEISKLRNEAAPLMEIEEGAKGRLLTLKESQAVGRKDEILQEIEQLEEASRGWFESDEAFKARLQASRSAWRATAKTTSKKKATGSSKKVAASAWSTPASRAKVATGSKPKSKSKPATRGGGVFAAMMMDSDSD